MSKHTEIEGYSVTAFVAVTPHRDAQTALDVARKMGGDIISHLAMHWRGLAERGVDIEAQERATCDSCGAPWTEKGDDYNAGCCNADEEDEEQRKRDNGALGVGA